MKIIDAHVHVWQKPVEGEYRMAGVRMPDNWQRDLLLGYMSECGVGKAIVVASTLGGNERNNEWIAQMVQDDPGHFEGLADVDPRSPTAIEELEKARDEFRLRGISLYLWPPDAGEWLLDHRIDEFWERVQQIGFLVSINISYLQADALSELARRYPRIKFIMCHLGRPNLYEPITDDQYAKVLELANRPEVYVKISGFWAFSPKGWDFPCYDLQRYVRMLTATFGSERMMWGSDFPSSLIRMTYRQSLEIVQTYCPFLSAHQKADLLGRTAERVLGA